MTKPMRIIILVAAMTASLLLISCGEQRAKKARYEIERDFFLANKLVEDAQIRPDLNDPETDKRIMAAFEKLAVDSRTALASLDPQNDSTEYRELGVLSYRAASQYYQLLFSERRFDSAAIVLSGLLAQMPVPPAEEAVATVRIAQALQAGGHIDSAVTLYGTAVRKLDPPVTHQGELSLPVFNVPAHLFRIAARRGDSTRAREALASAIAYYERQAQVDYPPLKSAANAILGRMYGEIGQWERAIQSLSQLRDSTGRVNPQAKVQIADIRGAQLQQYPQAIALYEEVINEVKGQDTLMRPALLTKKSLVQLEMQQFEEARKTLVGIQGQYPAYYQTNPLPQLFKARTFERENNWERAESEYKFLLDNYRVNEQTFQTLLHLAEVYQQQGRAAESQRMLERAEQTFNQAAAQTAGTADEALALSYKAELMRRKEDWKGAADVLESIFDKFPTTTVGRRAILTAASLYKERLGDQAKADLLVDRYIKSLTRVDEEES